MAITQEKNIEMLEKLADGNFKIKYPKTKVEQVIGLETAQKILDKIKTVDGAGSGLDADTLQGKNPSDFLTKELLPVWQEVKFTGTAAADSSTTKSIAIPAGTKQVELLFSLEKAFAKILATNDPNINMALMCTTYVQDGTLKVFRNKYTIVESYNVMYGNAVLGYVDLVGGVYTNDKTHINGLRNVRIEGSYLRFEIYNTNAVSIPYNVLIYWRAL